MYRHGRTATLNGSENDADSGVRLSCPLERIMDTHTGPLGSFPSVVSFRVDISKPSTGGDDDDDPEDSHVFQIGPILNIPEWSRLDEFIAAAKQRQKIEPTEILNPVLVDFGPLSFHEAESKSVADGPDVVDPQEKAVRASLALEAEPDVWSQHPIPFYSYDQANFTIPQLRGRASTKLLLLSVILLSRSITSASGARTSPSAIPNIASQSRKSKALNPFSWRSAHSPG